MKTITIEVSNLSILPSLEKVLNALDGIRIVTPEKRTRIQKAVDDAHSGKNFRADSVDDLMKHLLG
ncbi:hypothetical protein HPS57_04665 [Prevotella sp. PINT]|jgi:hypothetical protein|uniref:hypothetical protein n=1 Tax=Palleniella intestinalis TaxID=2736291 RepID=UPI0015551CFA|nr:hypothetical protein [Palleniella intestinalis]NPD81264.1 hypothetical protein [Palleniella intestinalis]